MLAGLRKTSLFYKRNKQESAEGKTEDQETIDWPPRTIKHIARYQKQRYSCLLWQKPVKQKYRWQKY